jgi:hypothetical protein
LMAATSADAFVEYANQGENKPLEGFIEGIASTGRRGTKEALHVIYNLLDDARPAELTDFCVRLAVASDAIAAPNLSEEAVLSLLDSLQPAKDLLTHSLTEFCEGQPLTVQTFVAWSGENFPMLSNPLSTFVHNLLFHGEAYPDASIAYHLPKPEPTSDIFSLPNSPGIIALSFASRQFGGKVSIALTLQ